MRIRWEREKGFFGYAFEEQIAHGNIEGDQENEKREQNYE